MTFALTKIERVNCEISGRSNCFPHSWLSMVQDDLMCNAYSQSMWSSAKFPVVFLLKFGWWEVNCCRKVAVHSFLARFSEQFCCLPTSFFSTEKITDNNMACVYDIPSCIHNFKRKDKNFYVSLWTVFLYPPLAPLLKRRTLEYFWKKQQIKMSTLGINVSSM